MKTVIIGGVAGGASAAARLRRLDENAEIVLLERGGYISFANCGLPYYIGGEIKEQDSLVLQSPESFRDRFQVEARIFSEVLAVDSNVRKVTVRNLRTGETYTEAYDKLILSPGAKPIIPPLPGADSPNVFTLRNIPDMLAIKDYIGEHSSKRAVVVGGGYIGIEMAENLKEAGLSVAIVEMQDHLMASLDFDMAAFVHNHLREKGIDVYLSNAVKEIQSLDAKTRVILAQGSLNADLVILAIGVRSDTDFLKDSGIALNERGGIIVNDHMNGLTPE